jgi:hypothetical protein
MLCSSSTDPSVMRNICGSTSWTLDNKAIALHEKKRRKMRQQNKKEQE